MELKKVLRQWGEVYDCILRAILMPPKGSLIDSTQYTVEALNLIYHMQLVKIPTQVTAYIPVFQWRKGFGHLNEHLLQGEGITLHPDNKTQTTTKQALGPFTFLEQRDRTHIHFSSDIQLNFLGKKTQQRSPKGKLTQRNSSLPKPGKLGTGQCPSGIKTKPECVTQ